MAARARLLVSRLSMLALGPEARLMPHDGKPRPSAGAAVADEDEDEQIVEFFHRSTPL